MGRFAIDLHVHTSRYSPCAPTMEPELILERLRARRLSGCVITDHDALWSVEELNALVQSAAGKREGFRLYRGVEITADHAHILALGLETLDETPPGVSIERLIDVAREQGAALIWAHPYLAYRGMRSPELYPEIRSGIHALEVASSMTKGEDALRSRRLARARGWSLVAGSDAHAPESIGAAATVFPFLPRDEKALAQAIISGHCRPKR